MMRQQSQSVERKLSGFSFHKLKETVGGEKKGATPYKEMFIYLLIIIIIICF